MPTPNKYKRPRICNIEDVIIKEEKFKIDFNSKKWHTFKNITKEALKTQPVEHSVYTSAGWIKWGTEVKADWK